MRASGFSRCTRRTVWRTSSSAAWGLAAVFARRLGDGAGVQTHQVGVTALCRRFQALGRKECLERGAIGLGGPAAKVLDEELTHLFHYSGADLLGCQDGLAAHQS